MSFGRCLAILSAFYSLSDLRRLQQAYARPSPVRVDELDPGALERRPNLLTGFALTAQGSAMAGLGSESYRFFSLTLAVFPRTAFAEAIRFDGRAGSSK
ncbi:MAG: hypothetical protein ACLPKB_04070 [Xanthobacteraceae bacterium]